MLGVSNFKSSTYQTSIKFILLVNDFLYFTIVDQVSGLVYSWLGLETQNTGWGGVSQLGILHRRNGSLCLHLRVNSLYQTEFLPILLPISLTLSLSDFETAKYVLGQLEVIESWDLFHVPCPCPMSMSHVHVPCPMSHVQSLFYLWRIVQIILPSCTDQREESDHGMYSDRYCIFR